MTEWIVCSVHQLCVQDYLCSSSGAVYGVMLSAPSALLLLGFRNADFL